MRNAQTQDFTIYYPSELTFAFNPNIIRLTAINGRQRRFSFSVNGMPKDLRYASTDNTLEINISRYLQLCFTREDIKQEAFRKTVTVNIYDDISDIVLFTFNCQVVWGGVTAGTALEDYEEEINLEESTDVEYLAFAGFDTFVRNNKGSWELLEHNTSTGYRIFDVSEYMGSGNKVIIQQIRKEQSSFDTTFDYTFLYKVLERHTTTYNISRCPKDGVMLKWVDNLGIIHARNFVVGALNEIVSRQGDSFGDVAMRDYSLGYPTEYQQGYAAKQEMTLAVPLATHAEWVVLKTLLTSPYVRYKATDGNWYDVVVKEGTTAIPSGIEDFVVSVQLPNIITQGF